MKIKKSRLLILFSCLFLLLSVYFSLGALKDLVDIGVLNNNSANGFVVSSTNGKLINSSWMSFANLSGVVNINLSLLYNGSHGGITNVTFSFQLDVINGSYMLNKTVFNNTFNQSSFNFSFNTAGVTEGIYNITVIVENTSTDGGHTGYGNATNYSKAIRVVIDRTAPNITYAFMNITNNTNITGSVKITINASANDTWTSAQVLRFGITLTNAGGNTTGFNVTGTRNFSAFSGELDTAFMVDGIYVIVIDVNDSLGNANNSVSNLTFVLDRAGPNVTNIFLGNFTNGANISNGIIAGGTAVLNITVEANDSITPNPGNSQTNLLAQVFFNITNSTGQINYTQAVANLSLWNSSLALNISDTRYFPDGKYYILVYANDSLNNRNRTQNLTFTIDRTNPSVSVSCSPSSATAGEVVTCTCTSSDDGSGLAPGYGFSGSTTTESTTASGSGTFTSGTCRANDYAGNTRSATGSWTVSAASSGGSSSGGSGGGSSSGVTGQFEKKTWTSINTDETATVSVANGVIGVTEVSFAVEETTYGAWVQVKKVDSLPSSVASFTAGDVYRRLEITENNVKNVLKGSATIQFKVEKSWLTDKRLSKEQVGLHRYVAGKWAELSTTVGQDDGTYVHFAATTPGFSYFVIGEKKTAPIVEAPAEEVVAPEEAPAAEAPESPAEELPEEGAKMPTWVIPVIAALVIAGLLYWYWKRK